MPEYKHIVGFRKTETDEFHIYMDQIIKSKKTREGYKVIHEIFHYGFETTRTDVPSMLFEDVRLQPLPTKEAEEAAKDIPVRPARGRAVIKEPKVVLTEQLPRLSYVYCHSYNKLSYDPYQAEFKTGEHLTIYNNYKVPRLLMLSDFESVDTLKEKLLRILFKYDPTKPMLSSLRSKVDKIKKVKQLHIYGVKIEGLHFNKVQDTSKLPFNIIDFKGKKIIEFKDDYFFSESLSDNGEINRWQKTKPVNEEKFLLGLKNHFLSRMRESIAEKEARAKKLEQELLDLQKDVGEIRFVEKSISNSTNTHFTGVIEKIRALPTVKSLAFTTLGFVIETKDLYIEPEEDLKLYVGRFEIVIEVTDSFKAEFRNLEAPETGNANYKEHRQHPHGSCQGSHYYVMMQAIKSLDYFTFVLAAIERLQTVNRQEQSKKYLLGIGYSEIKPKTNLKKFDTYLSLLNDEEINHDAYPPSEEDDREEEDYDGEDDDD